MFKEGLYTDDTNVPEGRLRGELPADGGPQQQATEQQGRGQAGGGLRRLEVKSLVRSRAIQLYPTLLFRSIAKTMCDMSE